MTARVEQGDGLFRLGISAAQIRPFEAVAAETSKAKVRFER